MRKIRSQFQVTEWPLVVLVLFIVALIAELEPVISQSLGL